MGHTGVVFIAEADESRTRDRVRRAVGEQGPVSARDLSTDLGLTPAAVRRHLDALSDDDLIAEHQAPPGPGGRGRGRPARKYVLTERGQEKLATSYHDVATAALHYLQNEAGTEALDAFANAHAAQLEKRLRTAIDAAGDDVEARTAALAEALSDEGFAATARPVAQGTGLAGIQLCQGHCPVKQVASEFRQFCDAETEMFSRLLGVHVQRLATLAGGEHVCTTFVPTGALAERFDGSVPTQSDAPPSTTDAATNDTDMSDTAESDTVDHEGRSTR